MEVKDNLDKHYCDFNLKQKRKIRELLDKMKVLRKEQLDLFEKLFIDPLKNQISLIDDFKHNDVGLTFRRLIKNNKQYSDWLENFFERGIK